jgi:hypothetical protein
MAGNVAAGLAQAHTALGGGYLSPQDKLNVARDAVEIARSIMEVVDGDA